MVGKDIKGPLGGEEVNFPPLQEPPPGCALGFSARHASPKQVSSYYEKKLIKHGWTVKRFPVKREGDFEYPHVEGSRDGLHYDVHYWPISLQGSTASAGWSDAMGEDGTEMNVLVYKPKTNALQLLQRCYLPPGTLVFENYTSMYPCTSLAALMGAVRACLTPGAARMGRRRT